MCKRIITKIITTIVKANALSKVRLKIKIDDYDAVTKQWK